MIARLPGKANKAFTLIELLVVIAIIAVLIGLLVPAVQKVREAANRMSCTNNLKQWGLALHSFHDANGRFPAGASATGLTGTGGAWGYSWLIPLLPYVEQQALYSKLNLNNSFWNDGVNGPALNNANFKTLHCPSSPLPESSNNNTNTGTAPNTGYVGIAGSANEAVATTWSSTNTNGGIVGSKGVLFPNSTVRFADITDGTTNVIMVGEQNNWITDAANAKNDWRGSQPHSFAMGFDRPNKPSGGPIGGDLRAFNTTTIRYQINAPRMAGQPGVPGVYGNGNYGNNTPLNSAHTGGANMLLGDASVKFMRESMTLLTLQNLAQRDDGVVISENY
ncbi:MAG: DUF1559 domain-containing protein [Planctomycetota bacterium]|nr:DUF1559 domain-containing protein [Planctomycetota bacterium]